MLLCFSFSVRAQKTDSDIYTILHNARDSNRGSLARNEAAQQGLDYIRKKVATDLGIKSVEDLLKLFATRPELESRLPLKDTQGLGKVLSEFNALMKSISTENALKKCEGYQRNLPTDVIKGMDRYSSCSENSWTTTSIVYQDPSGKNTTVPNFAFSKNIRSIVDASNQALVFSSRNDGKDPFFPSKAQLKSQNPGLSDADLTGIALTVQLRGKTYERAILNEIRNKVSLNYQYLPGSGTLESVHAQITQAVENDCAHCTEQMKKTIKLRVTKLIEGDIEQKTIQPKSPSVVVQNLCGKIRGMGYQHENEAKISEDETKSIKERIAEPYFYRRQVLASIVKGEGDGLLLLTHALTLVDGQVPYSTKLKCTDDSEEEDEKLISAATTEAVGKTKEFSSIVNGFFDATNYGADSSLAQLKELFKVSPLSVGEALQRVDTSGLGNRVCSIIQAINHQDAIKESIKDATIWGGMIFGAAITLATAGAAAPLTLASLATMGTLNGSAALYLALDGNNSKKLSDVYQTAVVAQGGDESLLKMSQKEAKDFDEEVNAAILMGVGSAAEFAAYVKMAVASGKSLGEINQSLLDLSKRFKTADDKIAFFESGSKSESENILNLNELMKNDPKAAKKVTRILEDLGDDPTQLSQEKMSKTFDDLYKIAHPNAPKFVVKNVNQKAMSDLDRWIDKNLAQSDFETVLKKLNLGSSESDIKAWVKSHPNSISVAKSIPGSVISIMKMKYPLVQLPELTLSERTKFLEIQEMFGEDPDLFRQELEHEFLGRSKALIIYNDVRIAYRNTLKAVAVAYAASHWREEKAYAINLYDIFESNLKAKQIFKNSAPMPNTQLQLVPQVIAPAAQNADWENWKKENPDFANRPESQEYQAAHNVFFKSK